MSSRVHHLLPARAQMIELLKMTAVILVFMVAFGVAEFVLLFPRSQFNAWLITDLLLLPYWQMHMELYQEKILQVCALPHLLLPLPSHSLANLT